MSKLTTSISGVNVEALRYGSVCTSKSIFVYFDVEAPFVEYRTRFRGTSLSNFTNFNIECECDIEDFSESFDIEDKTSISNVKSTNFDIEGLYMISKVPQIL